MLTTYPDWYRKLKLSDGLVGEISQRSACSPSFALSSCAIVERKRFGLLTMLCADAATQAARARIGTHRINSILASGWRAVDIEAQVSRQLSSQMRKTHL